MSKESKIHQSCESPENASDSLNDYDLSRSVRGKYYEKYHNLQGKIPVNIHTKEGDKPVILHTLKGKGTLDKDGHLSLDIVTDLLPGEYEVTITILEPQQEI